MHNMRGNLDSAFARIPRGESGNTVKNKFNRDPARFLLIIRFQSKPARFIRLSTLTVSDLIQHKFQTGKPGKVPHPCESGPQLMHR